MSRQVLDGKLITLNQPQFAFGPSYEGTRLPPLATPASGTKRTFSLARASLKQRLRGSGVHGSEDSI